MEEFVEPLKATDVPTLLLWGEEDEFRHVSFARRFEQESPMLASSRCPARHTPTEDDPERTGSVLANFFAGNSA